MTRQAARVRDKIARTQAALKRERANERVLLDQVEHLRDVADEAQNRRLLSQTPLADREWNAATSDLDRHLRELDETRARIADLDAQRDTLLDELFSIDST